jgi:hypothetical protein
VLSLAEHILTLTKEDLVNLMMMWPGVNPKDRYRKKDEIANIVLHLANSNPHTIWDQLTTHDQAAVLGSRRRRETNLTCQAL